MSNAVDDVFRSLVAERGGASALDSTQRIVALKLAEALVSATPLSAPTVNVLLSLLPEKSGADAAPYDLSKLSDEEFHLLDKLTAKMADAAVPPAPYVEPQWPKVSHRALYITETVHLLDQCEAEIENCRRKGARTDLPEEDLELIRNQLMWLMLSVATPEQVFRYLIDDAEYRVRKEFTEREEQNAKAVERLKDVLGPAPEPKPEPPPGNVQPLFGAFVTKRPRGSGPPWADGSSGF